MGKKNGKRIFNDIYQNVMCGNDVELWYADPCYSVDDCWANAAMEQVKCHMALSFDEILDLTAYVIECNPDSAEDAFFDGFGYYLGQMLMNEYEMGV